MAAVTNRRPARGELNLYKRTSPPEVEDIPEDYALVTRIHGVAGWGEILVLVSTSNGRPHGLPRTLSPAPENVSPPWCAG